MTWVRLLVCYLSLIECACVCYSQRQLPSRTNGKHTVHFYCPAIPAFCLLCGCDIMSELLSLGDVTKQHVTALCFPPLFSSSSLLSNLLRLHFCFTTLDTHPSPPSARRRVSPLCHPSFRQPPFCICQSLTEIEESWKCEGDTWG